ncbi:translation initiation factor IF-2-like [Dipodomys spectabilis]|uniref:translation initiation factor IF-2-like n=1 Tax=Dipodomys spectabilis TaxID=105255 RepID=UPI001C5428CF|nr:translation initiation factor IF-2-like [Dipodomys spectabilis]
MPIQSQDLKEQREGSQRLGVLRTARHAHPRVQTLRSPRVPRAAPESCPKPRANEQPQPSVLPTGQARPSTPSSSPRRGGRCCARGETASPGAGPARGPGCVNYPGSRWPLQRPRRAPECGVTRPSPGKAEGEGGNEEPARGRSGKEGGLVTVTQHLAERGGGGAVCTIGEESRPASAVLGLTLISSLDKSDEGPARCSSARSDLGDPGILRRLARRGPHTARTPRLHTGSTPFPPPATLAPRGSGLSVRRAQCSTLRHSDHAP